MSGHLLPPRGLGAGHLCHVVICTFVPVEMEVEDKLMPLCHLVSTLQDAGWSGVGSVAKGSIGDVCRVGGAGGRGVLATDQCFHESG